MLETNLIYAINFDLKRNTKFYVLKIIDLNFQENLEIFACISDIARSSKIEL